MFSSRNIIQDTMKNPKVTVPLAITGVNLFVFLSPVIILFPLMFLLSKLDGGILSLIGAFLTIFLLIVDLILMCLTPITQLILAIIAIVNRKWWLLLVHIPFIIITLGASLVFLDWFTNLNV